MASSSAVAEFSRPCPRDGLYDVFISFRGADTRFGFTDTLYRSLLENEIYTFIDGDLAGKVIESLFKIIETSRMAVVVYSENFASSHWCLRELELIMQRWEEKKMMILPIFYKVGVHEVKHPTEKITKHFDRLTSEHDGGAVEKWKDAVIKIGSVSGFVYKDIYGRSEHDFITQVLIPRIKKQLQQWEEGSLESTKPHNYGGPATEHHDVFISFMGRDTRYGLVNHLYTALTKMRKDTKTFMHDERDQSEDDNIVFEAIQRSKMSIVVFSENYASSKRCLRDLVKIIQCNNTTGQEVLPIFYEVNPSDLTNQAVKGSRIAYQLKKHARDEESDTVESWSDAITELGYMPGCTWRYSIAHSKKELADFIGLIVEEISTTLNRLDEKTKESTRNQQARVPAEEENTQALAIQTDPKTSGPTSGVSEECPVDVSEMDTALKMVEEEVLSSNDQQQQTDEECPTFEITWEGRMSYLGSVDVHPTKPWVLLILSGAVRIWNYETRAIENSFEPKIGGFTRAAKFVPEKHWIVTGDHDMFVRVLDYNTSKKLKEFKAHTDTITQMAVHPTLPYVLTASQGSGDNIKLWNWEDDWVCQQTFEGHSTTVQDVAFNPRDPHSFASVCSKFLKIWRIDSKVAEFTSPDSGYTIYHVDYFVGNGDMLYIFSGKDIWHCGSKTLVQSLERDVDHHNINTTLVHPKLPVILTSGYPDYATFCIWNKNTYQLLQVCNNNDFGRINNFTFIEASEEVIIGCNKKGLVVVKFAFAGKQST